MKTFYKVVRRSPLPIEYKKSNELVLSFMHEWPQLANEDLRGKSRYPEDCK